MLTSTFNSKPITGYLRGKPLKQDEDDSLSIEIPESLISEKPDGSSQLQDQGVTFKVTLAYTDRKCTLLQNNLKLIVVAADGVEKHGNISDGDGYDNVNNVEQINDDLLISRSP
ncbi:hypothetical protein N7G274_002987 [Stereocaulon virgatum]|uniref:Uncharacterized protein n=1 Tax=Stereocaulon virgatum TaxID=373712 RepID=A0ABR4AI27_9LECA